MMYVKNIALALIAIGLLLLITRNNKTENFEVVEMSSQGSSCWWNPTTTNNGCDSGLHCVNNNNKLINVWSPIGTCQTCKSVENNICTL